MARRRRRVRKKPNLKPAKMHFPCPICQSKEVRLIRGVHPFLVCFNCGWDERYQPLRLWVIMLIDEFSNDPIIKAYNGDAVSLTFKMEIDGKEVYVLVEDIPQNHPPSACWIFDDKKKLDEVLETLESNGWDIVVNEIN